MEGKWGGIALYVGTLVAFALGMTLWVIHMRRHPPKRMTPRMSAYIELTRKYHELAWSSIFAVSGLLALTFLLNWVTHAVSTGHPLPVFPKHSPWDRMIWSRHLRPWNLLGMGAFVVTLTATFYGLYHWPLRIIGRALRRASRTLALEFKPNATVFIADWRAKFLDSKVGLADALGISANNDFHYIANRSWALHRPGDESRVLVVSYGPSPAITRRDSRIEVWICLYVLKGGHGHRLRSTELMKGLGDAQFQVTDRSDYLRITDTRVGGPLKMRAVQDATSPERIVALWRAAEIETSAQPGQPDG